MSSARGALPAPLLRGGTPIVAKIRTNAVMTGLVPVIHVVKLPETFRSAGSGAAWMAGTSPAMTERADQEAHERLFLAPFPLTPPRFRGDDKAWKP